MDTPTAFRFGEWRVPNEGEWFADKDDGSPLRCPNDKWEGERRILIPIEPAPEPPKPDARREELLRVATVLTAGDYANGISRTYESVIEDAERLIAAVDARIKEPK